MPQQRRSSEEMALFAREVVYCQMVLGQSVMTIAQGSGTNPGTVHRILADRGVLRPRRFRGGHLGIEQTAQILYRYLVLDRTVREIATAVNIRNARSVECIVHIRKAPTASGVAAALTHACRGPRPPPFPSPLNGKSSR
jgi:hypothetical protein